MVLLLLKYTVLRLGLFVAMLGAFSFLGFGPVVALALAAVVSLLLSYVLLRGPRDALARAVADRAEQRAAGERRPPGVLGLDDDADTEDAVLDAGERRADPHAVPGADTPPGDPGP